MRTCLCGCAMVWSNKHRMDLCLHCDLDRDPQEVRAGMLVRPSFSQEEGGDLDL